MKSSFKELMVIINHFDQYPLITKKRLDFILFKEAFQLFIHKEHLTPYGLIKMASIKAFSPRAARAGKILQHAGIATAQDINKGLSINLKFRVKIPTVS